jgi:hypothetical protein
LALDLERYAYSFSHAIVRVNERQFTDITNVQISQDLTESAVYGTDMRPLKRSVGQLSMGQGQLQFSDMGEAGDFFFALGGQSGTLQSSSSQPFMATWSLTYQLARPPADVREIECLSCRILKFGIDHSAGAEALGCTVPFSFLAMKVDGREFALDPKSLLQKGLNVGQALVNLL